MSKGRPIATTALIVLFASTTDWADAGMSSDALYEVSDRVLQQVCVQETPAEVAAEAGVELGEHEEVIVRGRDMGWRARFDYGENDEFRVQKLEPGNRFRGARLEWWNGETPRLAVSADSECRIVTARRMRLDESGVPDAIVHLNQRLADTSLVEPLNPPVPPGLPADGVRVAMVDAGVNYTLPSISTRLARDKGGEIFGYDFWDLDRRPFDSNPARSVFFPQRHGTRTASLLLQEAQGARLVPYRYPRPDMDRMRDLLRHATSDEVKIIGIPLGGPRRAEWEAFSVGAEAMPGTLFVVSAGNRGVNIDFNPVYPASLDLDNMIVVTSADDSGHPAEGSNWGRLSVDLLVPAERQRVIDFSGNESVVSGSSYAVSRVSALAVRLLEQNPGWGAARLKKEIFSLAIEKPFDESVAIGYIPDPLFDTQEVQLVRVDPVNFSPVRSAESLGLDLHIGLLEDSGWSDTDPESLAVALKDVLKQCAIELTSAFLYRLRVTPRLLDFDVSRSHTLVTRANIPRPTVFLVRDTLREPAFEGEAFGQANTGSRDWLRDTVWLTSGIDDAELGLAHELIHVLSNSGEHSDEDGNLMQRTTGRGQSRLNRTQCEKVRQSGLSAGLLSPL